MALYYVSVDIETDGPLPGPHSMLSLGAAVFEDGVLVSTFSRNLELLEGSSPDPDTTQFWSRFPEQYAMTRTNLKPIRDVMADFAAWLKNLNGEVVFVAWPVNFDWSFVHYYFLKTWGRNPFGYAGLDMKSYAMAHLGLDFEECSSGNMPSEWFPFENPMKHVALFDAIEQGYAFEKMRASVRDACEILEGIDT